ncbi:hypothetical protein ASE00_10760 [Sphingomonas sp. Root710]|uniref:hypothetical protein n=1 Tax=Sphingomonas sp. Root710 TaxID=1736594 RepID=UPI000700DE4C|nr:hypothetical protein [Sphingomonas sp. Root710]KRB82526.1 hypothetical protein ASE00_10760 [Sphingomonas sp. Root710]
MTSIRLTLVTTWLAIGYATALACALFLLLDGLRTAAGMVLLLWMAGPAALASIGVRMSRAIRGAYGFTAMQLLVIASTFIMWAGMISVHLDVLNGVAMGIVLPLYQYSAIAILWCIAYLFGWRGRVGARSAAPPDR